MSRETEALQDREYLGDGVYVGHDDWHVVLWIEGTGAYGLNAIALEPGVIKRLGDYIERVRGARTP